jgi:hypothetical protein
MTEEQRNAIRERALKNQEKQRQANWAAGLAHEIVTRLADGIVTRAVNTPGAKTPAWGEAWERASAAFLGLLPTGREVLTADITNAENKAAEQLAKEDAPKKETTDVTESTDVTRAAPSPLPRTTDEDERGEGPGVERRATEPQLHVLPAPNPAGDESHQP